MQGNIMIIDDEEFMASMISTLLKKQGYETTEIHSAREARDKIGTVCPDIVLLDLMLPDAHGSELMLELAKIYPPAKFIIITGHGSVRSAVDTTHMGAEDYIEKPFETERLLLSVRNAMKGLKLSKELSIFRKKSDKFKYSPAHDVPSPYSSVAMKKVYNLALKAAKSKGSVLLLGETGVGKDHLAKWIHNHSERRKESFFSVNCAAISKELAESELFGHEPGAFTGAQGRKLGMLELAQKGTLLLNEIGELDIGTQAKLLTFLDTKKFLRIGGQSYISVDTHIIAATNRDLQKEVEAGTFRQDLLYRVNVFPIKIPALRERPEDLAMLIEEILYTLHIKIGLKKAPRLTNMAIEVLKEYSWPGNVRELQNVLERAIILAGEEVIGHEIFASMIQPVEGAIPRKKFRGLKDTMTLFERDIIISALKSSPTRQAAAEKLRITRHSLTYKMKVLNITDDEID